MHPVAPADPASTLTAARDAWHRRAWADAYAGLLAADRLGPLAPDDVERLAVAASLLGRDPESVEHWTRAHRDFLAVGAVERAVRCAFWLGIRLLERGGVAQGGGWLARARRLLDASARDCVEHGYLLLPEALEALDAGDAERAGEVLARAAACGERFGDRDLVALARHAQGRTLIRRGRGAEGVRALDEAMVAVTTGEVSPLVAGDVYCSVISGCQELFDWRRAAEWTAVLASWCAAQPDLVAYRGQCLLRRSEVLQLHGDWSRALEEARLACERLNDPPAQPGLAAAWYQLAELHRLRGDGVEAERGYLEAARLGRRPQPGLALLQLARGDAAGALSALSLALESTSARRLRARLLPAVVEAALSAGETAAARGAADELTAIAGELDAPYLAGAAAHADGSIQLAEGRPREALAALREAERHWEQSHAPYEAARTRLLVGLACRALGDSAGGALELEAARECFERLGAAPDLERLAPKRGSDPGANDGTASGLTASGLTAREVEVLRLVAGGGTNRAIAAALGLSEKTVARHLSNIFVKLDVSSRAAATAWAYEHAIIGRPPA